MLDVISKWITKVVNNRTISPAHKVVAPVQTTFIKGRYILESVVTAHEVLHSFHSSKKQRLVLKLDYEKAFDKVNIEFLEELLRNRGFGEKWIHLILQITRGGPVGVKLKQY